MWDTLEPDERLNIILDTFYPDNWWLDQALDVFVLFRHNAQQWGRIITKAAQLYVSPRQLQAAVDARLTAPAPERSTAWISHEQLMQTEYPDTPWAVDGLFQAGCTLLAGKPKHGKSFLTMQACYAVAYERHCLSHFAVTSGTALYFSLEDYASRVKKRTTSLFPHLPTSPYSVQWAFKAPTMGGGFAEHLMRELDANRTVRLVVIDTLRCIRDVSAGSYNLYQEDSEFVGTINQIGQDYCVAIVLVHHTRKAKGEDIFDEINGTSGMRGSSSTNMVLEPTTGEYDAILHVESKDLDGTKAYALKRTTHGGWRYVAEGEEAQVTNARKQIVQAIRELGPSNFKDVSVHVQRPYDSVRMMMQRMAALGLLLHFDKFRYDVPKADKATYDDEDL
jgi:hypothetical protein